jgi:hypothetical protein
MLEQHRTQLPRCHASTVSIRIHPKEVPLGYRDHNAIGIETKSGGKTKSVKYLETLIAAQRE